MAIKTYGYSPIVKNMAGYQDTYKTKKPQQVIPYMSQGYAAAKPAPLASLTPGYEKGQVTTPAPAPAPAPQPPVGTKPWSQTPQQQQAPFDPNVHYESDPVLQKIKLAAQGQRDTASSAARTRKVQLATQLGDTGFASELGLSEAEKAAAAANPLSDLAQLGRTEQTSTTALEDALNKSNLYFSGHRGTQLGELAQNFLGQRAGALGQARSGYAGILGDLLGAQGGADQMELDAEAAAYGRELDRIRAGGGAGTPPPGGTPPGARDATPTQPPTTTPPGTPPSLLPPGGGKGDIGGPVSPLFPPSPGIGPITPGASVNVNPVALAGGTPTIGPIGVGSTFGVNPLAMSLLGGLGTDMPGGKTFNINPVDLAGGLGPASKIRGRGGVSDLLLNLLGLG